MDRAKTRTGKKCKGHSKSRNGEPCENFAMHGRDVCRPHGGRTPRGLASPHYKSGKYSRYLPTKLAADYEEARAHPEIHSLLDEIALGESRLRALLKRQETSDLGHAWVELSSTWEQFITARTAGDTEGMRKALDKATAIIPKGRQDYLLWQNILDVVKTVADLRLKEHKRLVDLDLMMTQEKAALLFGLLQQAVHKAVTAHVDARLARRIFADIQAHVGNIDTRAVGRPRYVGTEDDGGEPVA